MKKEKNIYDMILERASDLRMLATQTDIDYDSQEDLTLEEKNYDHIVDDMRRRWNKVSELAEEIYILTDLKGSQEYWRDREWYPDCRPSEMGRIANLSDPLAEIRKANEEIERQQARIDNR